MRALSCVLAVCLSVIGCSSAGSLPSFIKACSQSNPNLNQCITDVIAVAGSKFAQGIPSLGIEPLDPVALGRINIDNPALKIVFMDTVVTGLSTFKVNSYKMHVEKKKAVLDFTVNCTLKAHYNIDGQILILPIRGDGPAKIKITNLNIIIKYDFDNVKNAAGEVHWDVTGYKSTYKMDRAYFKFQNLFGGSNKQLADTTLQFLNNNWELIMSEIAPPAIEEIIAACVKVVKKFFSLVPSDRLMLQ